MKRILATIGLALALSTTLSAQSRTAAGVMDNAARKIGAMKSVTAEYELTVDGNRATGTLAMSGDRFHLSSDDIMAWYDGKTQWSYSADTNEVSIIEPTPEELVAINPFVIISSFRKAYTPSLLKSAKGTDKVRLVPRDRRDDRIKEVLLTLDSSTSLPKDISITLDTGSVLDIKVKSIKTGTNYPHSTFVFNKKQLPKAEIVDLR